jgi:pimeloyl-ACP methyl ester carboxylesterase
MYNSLLILSFLCFFTIESKEVCYDGYGCFSDKPPFSGTASRPFSLLPQSPDKINTKFILYNRNERTGAPMSINNIPNIFQPDLPIKIICHGFVESSNVRWMLELRSAVLRAENVNVIKVDWGQSNGFPYTQATANTRIVGVEIARLLEHLVKTKGIKLSKVHLIGHSLGAHITGYAGKRLPGIGRITGLDPAGPYFEEVDKVVRLDKDDATFVDIIHTDAEKTLKVGLGIWKPIGHVDFYPNGGMDQPKCATTPEKLLKALLGLVTVSYDEFLKLACSHIASIYYFIDSTEEYDGAYTGYKCDSFETFVNGKCINCGSKGCNQMGHRASPNKELGSQYLNTRSTVDIAPYHLQNYQIGLIKNKDSNRKLQARGSLDIYFQTDRYLSSVENIEDGSVSFDNSGAVEYRLMSLVKPINDGEILKAFITYKRTSKVLTAWMYEDEWVFDKVKIFNGEKQQLAQLCPSNRKLSQVGKTEYVKC